MRKHKKQYANICLYCNKDFLAVQKRFKFCSPICAQKETYIQNMLDPEWRVSKLLALAKNRAKEKEVPFNLTKEYLLSLWNDNLGCCAVTGRLFELESSTKGTVNKNAPSLDRIIPQLGYVQGNVRFVVYILNCAMGEYGLEELRKLAIDIL